MNAPSSRSSDVRVARVPLATPTDTRAVAAVFMKTSEYHTKPATYVMFIRLGVYFLAALFGSSRRRLYDSHRKLEQQLLDLPSLEQLSLVEGIRWIVRRIPKPLKNLVSVSRCKGQWREMHLEVYTKRAGAHGSEQASADMMRTASCGLCIAAE